MRNSSQEIEKLRKKIDEIDNVLGKKINQRKKIVKKIMKIKLKYNIEKKDSSRELKILKRLTRKYPGESVEIRFIFKKLFKCSYNIV